MLVSYNFSDLSKQELKRLLERNAIGISKSDGDILSSVSTIIQRVKNEGDRALLEYGKQFDGINLEKLHVDADELKKIAALVPESDKEAIKIAYKNIKIFHESQLKNDAAIETMPGVSCWREYRAIEKVGLYVPGGSAVLPSTFLMLGIPARIVGCDEIVVCSPPHKDYLVNPYVAYCAQLLDINKIFLVGGAQAVAAMAWGTESVPKVYKIFGPGNRYVTFAKQLVQSQSNTSIDMPAGPSEVLVLAEKGAYPQFVAADLLAQCEHGADSQSVLLSNDKELIEAVQNEVKLQIENLSRKEIAGKAIKNSYAIHFEQVEDMLNFSNEYAPEHLILATDEWKRLIPYIKNAGSVFLGHLTPESAGDYASGTNHTLPTSAAAKSYSGVSVDSFLKKITFQHITQDGVYRIANVVETLASIEGLDAHKNAMALRRLN